MSNVNGAAGTSGFDPGSDDVGLGTLDFGLSFEIRKVNATNGAAAQTRMPYTFGKLGGSAGN